MLNKTNGAQIDLRKVINEGKQGLKDSPPEKRLAIVDVKRKRAIDSITAMFVAPVKYFIVSNIADPQNKATGTIQLPFKEDPPGSRSLQIEVNYALSCQPGNEKKFAVSLCADPNPGEAFKTLLFKWILEYINATGTGVFIDSFSRTLAGLIGSVKSKAREAGMQLELGLSVPSVPGGDRFTIKDSLRVRFADYDQEETIKLTGEFTKDQPHLFCAQADRGLSPQESIKRAFRDYFAAHASLQAFYFEPGRSGVKQEAARRISQVAQTLGCTLSFLSFERDGGLPLPCEKFGIRHPVLYSHDRGSQPVTISTEVEMDIKDSAKYRKAGSPEITQWVKGEVDLAVNRALFGSSYLEVLTNFEPLRLRIVRHMTASADRIGYSLRQLVTEPPGEALKLLKYFDIKTEPGAEQFRTSRAQYPVNLSIAVVTRLRDLTRVAGYLNAGEDVPAEMKKQMLAVVDRFLRSTRPEQFYTNFDRGADSGGESVVDALSKLIVDVLTNGFNAEISAKDISLVMEQTDMVQALNDLKRYREEFAVTIASLNTKQTYEVAFSGSFRVMDVDIENGYDGWESFSTSRPTIEQVRKCIVQKVTATLQNHTNLILAYQSDAELGTIESVIKRTASEAVKRDFGLWIEVDNIRRQRTALESRWIAGVQESNEHLLQRFEAERKRLLDHFIDALASGSREEELTSIKRQMAEVERHMESTRSAGRPSLAAASEPGQLTGGNES